MFNLPSPQPSTSMVLSHIPKSYPKNDILSLFANLPPNPRNRKQNESNSKKINIKQVIFHYFGSNIFLNKATIVFADEESAKAAALAYFGKMVGDKKMTIQYSYRPQPPFDQLISLMEPLDDVGIPNEYYQDNIYKREWMELSKFPSQIPENTSVICIRFNLIKEILYKDIHPSLDQTFQLVTYLNLKGNNIEKIEDTISFPSIAFCDLSFNKLTHSPKFITFCPKIETIFLNNNYIVAIDESIVSTNVNALHIQYNHIKSIPQLPNTVSCFEFDHNDIETIADFTVSNIKSISITHNKLSQIPKFDCSIIFNYSYNSILQINIATLPKLLTTLILHSNNISEIPESLFTDFPELTKVDLSKNLICNIPETFTVSKLVSFNISFNPKLEVLPKIPKSLSDLRVSFCQLTDLESFIPIDNNLIILYINGNKICKIPDYLNSIEVLFAADNFITDFPLIYKANSSIANSRSDTAFIDLSHNRISEIKSDSFCENAKIPTFNLIDLSYNNLKYLPFTSPAIHCPLFTRKSQIKLSGNESLSVSPNESVLDPKTTDGIHSIDISHTSLKFGATLNDMLREIITDEYIKLDPESLNDTTAPLTQNLVFKYNFPTKSDTDTFTKSEIDIGYAEMIGDRSEMEDALIIQQGFRVDSSRNIDLFALFDGHNGSSAARLAASGLSSMLDEINDTFITSPAKAINSVIANLHSVLGETNDMSGTTLDIVVLETQKINGSNNDQDALKKSMSLVVAHLGDSRVLLFGEDFTLHFVTEDMRCDASREELERFRSLGIPCRKMKAAGRLGVTGSIGDILYPGIRRVPASYEVSVREDDRWLVLACDGVFEELENEEVADVLRIAATESGGCGEKGPSVAKRAATLIRDYAFERGSTDNISVIVVDLKA